jgi:hypothetical protein
MVTASLLEFRNEFSHRGEIGRSRSRPIASTFGRYPMRIAAVLTVR